MAKTFNALAQMKFRIWAIWLNIRKHMLSVIQFTNIGKLTDPRNSVSGVKFLAVLAQNSAQKQLALSSFQFHTRCNILNCMFGWIKFKIDIKSLKQTDETNLLQPSTKQNNNFNIIIIIYDINFDEVFL